MSMRDRLYTREDLIQLREHCMNAASYETKEILVCGGTGCVAGGSLQIYDHLKTYMEEHNIPVNVELADDPHSEVVGLKKSGCHGFCELGPLVRVEPQGWLYTKVKESDVEEIIERTILKGENIERLAYRMGDDVYLRQDDIPFYKKQTRHVLENCGQINATSIFSYLSVGGYTALEKALAFAVCGCAVGLVR